MISTTQFRKGVNIEYDGKPYVIVEFQHVNPGKGSAFVRTRIKNLETAQVLEVTFKAGDVVPEPDLEFRYMQYLYFDGTNYTFMDNNTYEQFSLTEEDLGDNKYYILPDSTVRVTFFKGRPVSVEIDTFVNLKVIETQPNIRGDTATGGGKPATLETWLVITVPFHVNVGEVLKVDTRTNKYIEKVKE